MSMKGEDLERLQLPLMVLQKENDEKLSTAFTVSVVCTIAHDICQLLLMLFPEELVLYKTFFPNSCTLIFR